MNMIEYMLLNASAEVGTKEEPIGSNNVKYNTEYYGHPVHGENYPWCVVFIWWLFKQCGLSYLFYGGSKTASCTTLLKWAISRNMVKSTPKAGDLVIFQWANGKRHIGIIEKATSKTLYTIEGNASDKVEKKKRDYGNVIAFIRPEYTEIKPTTIDSASVWSQPIKRDEYRIRRLPIDYPVTVLLDEIQINGDTWYRTIKGNYILTKCFKKGDVKA